jgi:hypothetical protein
MVTCRDNDGNNGNRECDYRDNRSLFYGLGNEIA